MSQIQISRRLLPFIFQSVFSKEKKAFNVALFSVFLFMFFGLMLPVKAQTQAEMLEIVNNPAKSQVSSQSNKINENPEKAGETANAASLNLNPTGNIFYVAPNGSASGNGSLNAPWDFKTALSHPASVIPGDTILLRGGVYNVPTADLGFMSSLTGTAANPIKVMSYPGEWAVIDGNVSFSTVKSRVMLRINGGYTWFANFEITNTEISTRKIAVTGSNPTERRANSIDDNGMGTKIINLIIHDTGQGIAAGNDVNGNEYYGNVVYNNGWDSPDGPHGHGNYVQNRLGSKLLENNFFFNNFSFNSQMYGSNLSASRNFTWIGNVFFNGGMAWWGPNIENLTVTENYTYNNLFKVGNGSSPTNLSATIRNNYFMHGVFLDELAQHTTFTNNTVWHNYNDGLVRLQLKNTFFAPARYTFNNNTYYKGGINAPQGQFRIDYNGGKKRLQILKRHVGYFAFDKTSGSNQASFNYTRKSWKHDLRFDVNSTWIDSAPTGLKVFIRPNRYDPKRSNLIVYNWDRNNEVNVDVSSVLNAGDTYELRSVQDYFGDVVTGTYAGGLLRINMIGRTLAKPIGYDQITTWYHNPLRPTTFPVFGAFVLIKTSN